jgi:hypothetical protein
VAIFWNEIEILELIDACDSGDRGGIHSGIALAQTLAADRGVGLTNGDDASLIRELFVLHRAGLVTWQVMSSHGRVQPISPNDPNDYLNNIREFALTVSGRDRARGQIIQVPTPDPAEDDGRMIASLTLEEVARSIDAVYAPFQAIRLLIEAGISPEHDSGEDGETWQKVLLILVKLSVGTWGQRRELRHFLGAWLDDELPTGPSDDEREKVERDLARQGWFAKDGRLVIGECVRGARGASRAPAAAVDELHPSVWEAAAPQLASHHLHDAVLAACKAVNATLQAKVGRSDLYEGGLVVKWRSVVRVVVLSRLLVLERRSCLYGLLIGRTRRNWMFARAQVQRGRSGRQTKSGASGSELFLAGKHVPDCVGESARDVDLGDFGTALLAEPALGSLVALGVGGVP